MQGKYLTVLLLHVHFDHIIKYCYKLPYYTTLGCVTKTKNCVLF